MLTRVLLAALFTAFLCFLYLHLGPESEHTPAEPEDPSTAVEAGPVGVSEPGGVFSPALPTPGTVEETAQALDTIEQYLDLLDSDPGADPQFASDSRGALSELFAEMIRERDDPQSAIDALIMAMELTPSTPLGNVARHEAAAALSTILLPENGVHSIESRRLQNSCADLMARSGQPAVQQMLASGLVLAGNCTPESVAERRWREEGIELRVIPDFPERLWSIGRSTTDPYLRAMAIYNLPQTRDSRILDEAVRHTLDSDSIELVQVGRGVIPLVLEQEAEWRAEAARGDAEIASVPNSRSRLIERVLERASRPGTGLDVIQVLIATLVEMGESSRVHELRRSIHESDHSPAALAALDRQILAYPLPD